MLSFLQTRRASAVASPWRWWARRTRACLELAEPVAEESTAAERAAAAAAAMADRERAHARAVEALGWLPR